MTAYVAERADFRRSNHVEFAGVVAQYIRVYR